MNSFWLASSPCAPGREEHFHSNGTCLMKQDLGNNTSSSLRDLLIKLKKDLKCNDDQCLAERLGLDHVFRPRMPHTWQKSGASRTWLSTQDINSVMQQYTYTYPFTFLGVHPIDFFDTFPDVQNCISPDVCAFIQAMKNCKRKDSKRAFGLVLNLDKHYQRGSHWVCVYMDLRPKSRKYGACYYDSSGSDPPEQVNRFLRVVKGMCNENFNLYHNTIQHQHQNTECGMFCMAFLISCLLHQDEPYATTLARIPSDHNDTQIFQQRKKLFSATKYKN